MKILGRVVEGYSGFQELDAEGLRPRLGVWMWGFAFWVFSWGIT